MVECKRSKTYMLLLCIFVIFSPLSFSEENNKLNSPQLNELNELNGLLAQHKGKVIYLDFWASWCVPCRKSFPWLNKIQETYATKEFTVISINLDSDKALAEQFLQKLPARFPVVYDPTGDLAKKFEVKGMPSSYLINSAGKITKRHIGFFTEQESAYEEEIEHLITQSDPISENKITNQAHYSTQYIHSKEAHKGQHERL